MCYRVMTGVPHSHVILHVPGGQTGTQADPCVSPALTHTLSQSPTNHTDTLRYPQLEERPRSPTLHPERHPNRTGYYTLAYLYSQIRRDAVTLADIPPHTLPSPSIQGHPRLDTGTNLGPFPCARRWPGFLRSIPQGRGGGPGWRWVCTPSWLTPLSHRKGLTWNSPQPSVGTGPAPAPGLPPQAGGHRGLARRVR